MVEIIFYNLVNIKCLLYVKYVVSIVYITVNKIEKVFVFSEFSV